MGYAFFHQNVVSEYTHEDAVADGVNVQGEIYTIETEVSQQGGMVLKGLVERREKLTRARRWQQQDENEAYSAAKLDRDIVNPSQIRTVVRAFRQKLPEIFPDRTDAAGAYEVPKTLIFAKTDSHADDIINIVREEFGEGNAFCKKVTFTILKSDLTESGLPVYSAGVSTEPWGFLEGCAVSYGPETLVISARGNIGMPKRPRQTPFVCTQTTIACSSYLPETVGWLFWFLSRYDYSKKSSQTTIPMLRTSDVDSFEVPLPPLPEQKRIVAKIEELFSELEAEEERLWVARRQLGVYRQSLLKQAFEGKLTTKWRTQTPAKLEVWSWLTLEAVADVTGGLTKNAKRDSLPTRIPYLRVANVYANELRLDEIKDIGVKPEEAKKVRLVKGDLLIVEGNGSLDQIGRVALWDGSISNCGHQNHLIRARCRAMAHPAFVLMFLLSPRGRSLIEKQAASTSGLHTLSVSKVQRLPVPLCSLPEPQEIVRVLDEQFEGIGRNEREIDGALRSSEALRQAILQKAFTGRLVPQDPSDEPASELLARLRAKRNAAAAAKPTKRRDKAAAPA